MKEFLSYHPKTGLQVITELPFPASRVGTYIGEYGYYNYRGNNYGWKLRVKRRTKGSTWKQISPEMLPKELKLSALVQGVQL